MVFLVEYYEPNPDPSTSARIAERARAAVRALAGEGAELRFLRATHVPADETCFLAFEASSADLVAEAVKRTAIRDARLMEAREDAR